MAFRLRTECRKEGRFAKIWRERGPGSEAKAMLGVQGEGRSTHNEREEREGGIGGRMRSL